MDEIVRALEQIDSDHELLYPERELRMYQTPHNNFIRVLDSYESPLTAEMLEAIDAHLLQKRENECDRVDEDGTLKTENECAEESVEEPSAKTDGAMEEEKDYSAEPINGADLDRASEGAKMDGSEMEPEHERAGDDAAVLDKGMENGPLQDEIPMTYEITDSIALEEAVTPEGSITWPPLAPEKAAIPIKKLPELQKIIQLSCSKILQERMHICYAASPSSQRTEYARCILYWQRSCLQSKRSNYGLQAATALARYLHCPVLALAFVPNSMMLPKKYAATANDVYIRSSFLEFANAIRANGISLYAITHQTFPNAQIDPSQSVASEVKLAPQLVRIFSLFQPHVVITDDAYHLGLLQELSALTLYLQSRSEHHPWSLIAVDSQGCVPLRLVKESLSPNEPRCLNKARFKELHSMRLAAMYMEDQIDSAVAEFAAVSMLPAQQEAALVSLLKEYDLELVDWYLVKALASRETKKSHSFTESAAHRHLTSLLGQKSSRPTIQEELEVGGIVSLLPFIRHGTLSSSLVLHRLKRAISSGPTDDRRMLARLKVLNSRALHHLAIERDYALYLSLQLHQHLRNPSQILLDVSISSLHNLSSSKSYLHAYMAVMPAWTSSPCANAISDSDSKSDLIKVESDYECSRTSDERWNLIQASHRKQHFFHSLLIPYWANKILVDGPTWMEALMLLEALLLRCSLGSHTSGDAVMTLWIRLFRVENGAMAFSDQYRTDSDSAALLNAMDAWKKSIVDELQRLPKISCCSAT